MVSANYAGASASEMETFVARPLENSLNGIDNIEDIHSTHPKTKYPISASFS